MAIKFDDILQVYRESDEGIINLDGGSANSVYLAPTQKLDGGNSTSF